MGSKLIRAMRLRRSPRLSSLIKKKKAVRFLKKKTSENEGKRAQRLEHLARGSEASQFLRRSPRLKNVSCDLKPQSVLEKKSVEFGGKSRANHNLKDDLLLEETELFVEAVRVLNKSLINKRRSKRKRRENGFEKLVSFASLTRDKIVDELKFKVPSNQNDTNKNCTKMDLEKSKSIEGSKRFIKVYKRRLKDKKSGSKAINPTDCNYNLDLDRPNGDSSSTSHEILPLEPTNISKTDINANSNVHTIVCSTDPNQQVLGSERINNDLNKCNVGATPFFPFTTSQSKSNNQQNQISEPIEFIMDSAKTALNETANCNMEPCLIGPGTPGPSSKVNTCLTIVPITYSFNNGTANSNMAPSSMVHDIPGPSNSTKDSILKENFSIGTDNSNVGSSSMVHDPSNSTKDSILQENFTIGTFNNSNVGPSSMLHGAPGPPNNGFTVRKARSPRFLRFTIREKECNAQSMIGNSLNQIVLFKSRFENNADCDQNPSQKIESCFENRADCDQNPSQKIESCFENRADCDQNPSQKIKSCFENRADCDQNPSQKIKSCFENRADCNQNPSQKIKSCFENCADCDQNPSQMVKFVCSGTDESAKEDPDWNQNKCGLKSRMRGEKRADVGRAYLKKRGRDTNLHRMVFEQGGLPDGSVLTYRTSYKILLTGYKHGDYIVCACHNTEMRPSQFEAHAGMARRRKPYHHIYTSDGKTLHDLCLELASVPKPISEVQVKFTIPHRDYFRKVSLIPTNRKLIRILKTLKGIIISCSICKDSSAAIGDEKHSKLINFCNQCNKAYHVGCLDNKESFNIEDVLNKSWFCCTNCSLIHTNLKKLCTSVANTVPSPFLDYLKKQKTEEKSFNIEWQIFSGNNAKDEMLLQALQVLKSAFQPIIEGEKNLIRSIVFGKEVIEKGLDFSGVFCVAVKVDGEIVSVAVLRVFGQFVAEIPLVTTSKFCRRKGYFRMLLSLIEELLGLLKVRLIVAPVHDKMQPIWIKKFGFVKSTYQHVQMLRERHAIMLFDNTDLLEKGIPVPA